MLLKTKQFNLFKVSKLALCHIFYHLSTSLNRALTCQVLAKHCVIQTNRGAGSVFQTTGGGPATFKDDLTAPRDTLIKAAACCSILLCLMGRGQLMSGCLYERSNNCVAQMRALNTARLLSDGCTVKVESLYD